MSEIMNKTLGEIGHTSKVSEYKRHPNGRTYDDVKEYFQMAEQIDDEYNKVSKEILTIFAQHNFTIPEISRLLTNVMDIIIYQTPIRSDVLKVVSENF